LNGTALAFPVAIPTGPAAEVDELGRLQAQIALLKPALKREEELKKILVGYGVPVIQGAEFVCTVTTSFEDRLDSAAIRADMGVDWCNAYTKTGAKKTVRTAAKTP